VGDAAFAARRSEADTILPLVLLLLLLLLKATQSFPSVGGLRRNESRSSDGRVSCSPVSRIPVTEIRIDLGSKQAPSSTGAFN
jgi:hypothetical protein